MHNPFSRPPSAVTLEKRSAGRSDRNLAALDLRATLVSSDGGLANVDGRILRLGDTVDGHILLKVYEDRAIFSRESRNLTIYVKPDLVKSDD